MNITDRIEEARLRLLSKLPKTFELSIHLMEDDYKALLKEAEDLCRIPKGIEFTNLQFKGFPVSPSSGYDGNSYITVVTVAGSLDMMEVNLHPRDFIELI